MPRVFRSLIEIFARRAPLVGGLLLVIGLLSLGSLMFSLATQPLAVGQFGIDFHDYYRAGERIAAGASPYHPDMLLGPLGAQGVDRYRYPPPFAAALAPLTLLLERVPLTVLWLGAQLIMLTAAVIISLRLTGRPTRTRIIGTLAAVAWFFPTFDVLHKGNVGGALALGVALTMAGGTVRSGTAVAAMSWLKLAPAILAPAVVARYGWRGLLAGLTATALIVGPALLLLPGAWADYGRVLPNLLGGSADYAANLAPDQLLRSLGLTALAPLARAATLLAAAALLAYSVIAARRADGWIAAVQAATVASLLIPGAIWSHYAVILLPGAIVAWQRAGRIGRLLLVAGYFGLTLPLDAAEPIFFAAFAAGAFLPLIRRGQPT